MRAKADTELGFIILLRDFCLATGCDDKRGLNALNRIFHLGSQSHSPWMMPYVLMQAVIDMVAKGQSVESAVRALERPTVQAKIQAMGIH